MSETKTIYNCPHTTKPYYAKGFCKACYHLHWRVQRAVNGEEGFNPQPRQYDQTVYNCPHTTKPHYAKGFCKPCYVRITTDPTKVSDYEKTDKAKERKNKWNRSEKGKMTKHLCYMRSKMSLNKEKENPQSNFQKTLTALEDWNISST